MADRRESSTGSRLSYFAPGVLFLCCAVLLGLNYNLKRQNSLLDIQARSLKMASAPLLGSVVPTLHGQDLSGKAMTIQLSGGSHPSLVLALSPICPYTKMNFQNWKDLLTAAKGERIIWVDLTGLADAKYFASMGVPPGSTIIRLSPEERTLYNLQVTPTTTLLDSNGTVRWVWPSVLGVQQMEELGKML